MWRVVASTTATSIAILAFGAVSGILLARMLGPVGRGEFASVMLWPSILSALCLFGTEFEISRQAAARPKASRQLRAIAIQFSIVLGAVATIVGAILLPWLLPSDKQALLDIARILCLVAPASMLNVLVSYVELGRGNYALYNIIRVAFSPIYITILIAIAVFASPSVFLVALGFIAAAYVGAGFSVIYARSKDSIKVLDLSGPTLCSISRGAIPFAGSTIVLVLASQLSQILLISLTDLHSVGLYVVALVVATAHSSFGNAVAKVAFATMARGEKSDSSLWFAEMVRFTTAIYVVIAIAIFAVGPFLIPILFGTAFNEASMLLLGLIPATTMVAIGQVIDHGLQGLGIVSGGVRARIASSLLLAVLAIALTPHLGVYGIVYGVMAASVLELAVLCVVASSKMGVPIGDFLFIKLDELHRLRSKLGLILGRR